MKTSLFFRMIVLAAIAIASIGNTNLKAQESNFVTNEVKDGDLVKSKVIYRLDGSLSHYMKYDFSYDNQKRMISKEAFKWGGERERWIPYFKITYLYSGTEITMEYARWNEAHRAYDSSVEKSVYEINDSNIPVAYMNYRWSEMHSYWKINIVNVIDNKTTFLVYVE